MTIARVAQRVGIGDGGHDLHVGVDREQLPDALAHDQAVLAEGDPDRH
jgi:hypothetical protein